MLVSYSWLVEHINDPCVVILDSRGNVAYSYAHMPNSQPLGIEKVVKTNQYGANLVLDEEQAAKLFEEKQIPKDKELVCCCALGQRGANIFTQLKIVGYENVKLYDGSIADWIGRRLPLT